MGVRQILDMLRPMAVTESTVREIELHGRPVTFRHVGQAPAVVLIHGITSSSKTWRAVMRRLILGRCP